MKRRQIYNWFNPRPSSAVIRPRLQRRSCKKPFRHPQDHFSRSVGANHKAPLSADCSVGMNSYLVRRSLIQDTSPRFRYQQITGTSDPRLIPSQQSTKGLFVRKRGEFVPERLASESREKIDTGCYTCIVCEMLRSSMYVGRSLVRVLKRGDHFVWNNNSTQYYY